MDALPMTQASAVNAFLLAFPALFSIVNPLGGALIFSEVTMGRSHAERAGLAGKVGLFSAFVLLASLWLGGYVLNFFGITLGALRIAGGIVVSFAAWRLLMTSEQEHQRKQDAADAATTDNDIAFFPLTMPLTTGPGTISVAIALASVRPAQDGGTLFFFLGVSLAAIAVAVIVWVTYRWADRLLAMLGVTGARIFSRLAAFLLLCIGVQIVVSGVTDVVTTMLGHAGG
jgi:multiple antibiotic resistance protein